MQDPGIEVFVGVDMAKDEHFAQAITANGVDVFARPVDNDQADIEALIATASEHGVVALVVDMSASSAQLLLSVAQQRSVPVAYVTGLQMRRAAQLYAGTAKTDPIDAWVLADYARRNIDRLSWLDVSDDLLVRLRVLNGRDVDLAADVTRTINRCRDALTAVSPALERAIGSRLGTAGIRDALLKWSTPSTLRSAGKTRIRNTIKKRSSRTAARAADTIWSALEAQTLTLAGEQTWGEIISDLVGDLDRLLQQRDDLTASIEEAFLSHPLGKVLVTLCGFGPRTGARTLAEIRDPNRFATGGRLAAYAGLAPTDRRSGRSINNTSRNRSGNRRLKNAMFLAAFVATQHDPHARAYYQRKRDEGKRHNTAVICVARRRCDLILAMLKTGQAYDSNRHQETPIAA